MLFTVGYNLRKPNLQMIEVLFEKKHRLFFCCVMLYVDHCWFFFAFYFGHCIDSCYSIHGPNYLFVIIKLFSLQMFINLSPLHYNISL